MGLVMKSGVIRDCIMRRNKKDHRNENAENAQWKEEREIAGTVLGHTRVLFSFKFHGRETTNDKKSVTESYEM